MYVSPSTCRTSGDRSCTAADSSPIPSPAMAVGAAAPPSNLGARKTWTSSIARTSNRLPSTRLPPSTRTLVHRRRPNSASKASSRAAWLSPPQTKTSHPASRSRER